nr:uncharacterized protein LOC110364482 isoform X3 [Columba livia]
MPKMETYAWLIHTQMEGWLHLEVLALVTSASSQMATPHLVVQKSTEGITSASRGPLSRNISTLREIRRTTTAWLTSNPSATSHVVLRGSALMVALKWSLSTSDGRSLCSSSSNLLSPLRNFLNHHCTVRSLAVPGPDALLMLQVVSSA